MTTRNIISGVGDGTFQPERQISRAELVTMLAGIAKLEQGNAGDAAETETVGFGDVPGDAWYHEMCIRDRYIPGRALLG